MQKPLCKKQYFNNLMSTLPLTDLVMGIVDEEAKTITLFFPYPFQLVAFGESTEWPAGPLPVSELPMVQTVDVSRGNSASFSQLILELATLMMYANRDKGDYLNSPFLGSVQYEEKALAKFANYFYNYLNPSLKTYFYNQFLFALYYVNNFWVNEAGYTDAEFELQFKNLQQFLFNNTDRRLWLAPGLYTIYYGDNVPEGDNFTPPLTYSNYSS